MDAIKDIFEAYNQRIKSPFFGYIVLAFFILNWKPAYYLLFAEVTPQAKFDFVEANSDWQSLIVLPIVYGVFAGLAKPWISYWGSMWAENPVNRQKEREIKAADKITRLKNTLIQAQNTAIENLLEASVQEDKINQIADDQVRGEVKKQAKDIRTTLSSYVLKSPKSNRNYERELALHRIGNLEKMAAEASERGDDEESRQLLTTASVIMQNMD